MDAAAAHHPLKRLSVGMWGRDEKAVKEEIATKMGQPWPDIEENLFNDVTEFHKLASFDGYSGARELLNRYNVAQAQGVLLDCIRMRVEARSEFKEILRYAKLARLLHHITRVGESHYIFEFSGPASVLNESRRYGANMAKFLPSLLRRKDWKMEAVIRYGRGTCKFAMSSEDPLRPSWPEDTTVFDSAIEEAFVEKWGEDTREGWSLAREADILWKNQHVFTPDFLLRHEDGRRVFLEIAGFWSKEYIAQKRQTLADFKDKTIILAVPKELAGQYGDLGQKVLVYNSRILIQDVMEVLEGIPK